MSPSRTKSNGRGGLLYLRRRRRLQNLPPKGREVPLLYSVPSIRFSLSEEGPQINQLSYRYQRSSSTDSRRHLSTLIHPGFCDLVYGRFVLSRCPEVLGPKQECRPSSWKTCSATVTCLRRQFSATSSTPKRSFTISLAPWHRKRRRQ